MRCKFIIEFRSETGYTVVFYRVNGTDVYIDRMLYGRRDYLRVLFADTGTTES